MNVAVKNRSDIFLKGHQMVIIERGATADVELNSDQYRSALVQGGLEIKCKVTVKVPNVTNVAARAFTEKLIIVID